MAQSKSHWPFLLAKWRDLCYSIQKNRNEEATHIFTIILMAAFAVYVLWDVYKTRNSLKLLFLLPVAMSVMMFPPFVTMMSGKFFAVYRTVLIIVCLLIILVYFVSVRKRQTAALRQKQKAKPAQQGKNTQQQSGKKKK